MKAGFFQLLVKPVDKKSLPKSEVIAIGRGKVALVGYVYYDRALKEVVCESDGEILEGVTHYIIIPNTR